MSTKALQKFGPVRSGAVVGVVLAGGEGRRMGPGALKPLRLLAGRPMVAHVVDRLRPQVMDLVIVANDPAPEFRALEAPVIADPADIQEMARREGRRLGPLAGILAGMEWARDHHPHCESPEATVFHFSNPRGPTETPPPRSSSPRATR